MTSGLETEWDYSGRKGRDGQKKKIVKANERKGKVKRGKDEDVNGHGEKRGALDPHGEECIDVFLSNLKCYSHYVSFIAFDNQTLLASAGCILFD